MEKKVEFKKQGSGGGGEVGEGKRYVVLKDKKRVRGRGPLNSTGGKGIILTEREKKKKKKRGEENLGLRLTYREVQKEGESGKKKKGRQWGGI